MSISPCSFMITTEELEASFETVRQTPSDNGLLEMIVVRPSTGVRELRDEVFISAENGLDGDKWRFSQGRDMPEGQPDPRVQVTLMNARILRLISGGDERMTLAGDNLIVDLDLSEANMTAGQRLSVGEAVLEITEVPHTGCGTFLERYGRDAVKFINSPDGKRMHLRGVHARVIDPGVVRVGDTVRKI